MSLYDVYWGTERHATACVQDDGQKDWVFSSEWGDFWVDKAKQKGIEYGIGYDPHAVIIRYEGCTAQKRP